MDNYWKNKNVLVTGGGGFIGSHLVEALVRLGAKTRALIHYNSSNRWGWLDQSEVKNDIEVICGDIRDRDSVKSAVKDTHIVFHLAALIAIPYSYSAPSSYVNTNIIGTLNVLQSARDYNIEHLIHTSTSEVYGTAKYVPIDEKHPLQGQSPYSASKIGADKMVESFNYSFDLPTTIIRPFNTFGPRQSARAIIPTIITQCLTGKRVRLGNLNPMRDLNYVSNTVDGYIRAATSTKAMGQTINLGSGIEISIGDLVKKISGLINKDIEIEQEKKRLRPANSEVNRLLADNSLAKSLLNWKPEVSLEEGLKKTIEWTHHHLNYYRPDCYTT